MNQPSIMYTEVVFGPNFQAVVEILMSAFLATPGESNRLDRLALQHISASHVECLSSALWSTEAACMAAGREAAVRAIKSEEFGHRSVVRRPEVRIAALAAVAWDLATEDGLFTFEQRDLIMEVWAEVFGLPASLEVTK